MESGDVRPQRLRPAVFTALTKRGRRYRGCGRFPSHCLCAILTEPLSQRRPEIRDIAGHGVETMGIRTQGGADSFTSFPTSSPQTALRQPAHIRSDALRYPLHLCGRCHAARTECCGRSCSGRGRRVRQGLARSQDAPRCARGTQRQRLEAHCGCLFLGHDPLLLQPHRRERGSSRAAHARHCLVQRRVALP